MVGAGVAVGAALGAGVGLAPKARPQVRRTTGNETNLVRIIGSKAFKSGQTKNKRFFRTNAESPAFTGANFTAGDAEPIERHLGNPGTAAQTVLIYLKRAHPENLSGTRYLEVTNNQWLNHFSPF